MKRLLILLALIFVPTCQGTSWAQCNEMDASGNWMNTDYCGDVTQLARLSPAIVGGGVPTGAAPDACGTTYGTYKMVWTGDHASGDTYICHTNGTGSKDLDEVDAGVDFSTDDITITQGTGVYAGWVNASNDIFDDAAGTLYFTLNVTDDGDANFENCALFEIPDVEFTDSYYMYVWIDATGDLLKVNWNDGTNSFTAESNVDMELATNYRVGIRWRVGETPQLSISVVALGNAHSWVDNNPAAMAAWPTDAGFVFVGNHYLAKTSTDIPNISNIVILGTYNAADPL